MMESIQKPVYLDNLAVGLRSKEKWMVAAWCVEDGQIKMVDLITEKFPCDDFLAAIGQLAQTCFTEKKLCDKRLEEEKKKLPDEPLPRAKPPEVYGANGNAEKTSPPLPMVLQMPSSKDACTLHDGRWVADGPDGFITKEDVSVCKKKEDD